jgi:hypothetical protein
MAKTLKKTTKLMLILCFIIPFFTIQKTHAEERNNDAQTTYRKSLADGIENVKDAV